MRRKTVTIRDVAKKAGVGVSTVSYVLNGDDIHVGAATREHILATIKELNYRPNAIARSMSRKKTATIGVIITEIGNPMFVSVIQGIEGVLREEGYHIILASANNVEREISAIETLRDQQVDGFIFMAVSVHYPESHLDQLQAEEIPFVVINRSLDNTTISQISFDDYGAAREATQHLIDLGHRAIGTVTGPRQESKAKMRHRSAVQRYAGWYEALQNNGLDVVDDWILPGQYTYEGGYEAGQRLLALPTRPTAVFAANDDMSIGLFKAFYDADVRIPDAMSVITIGDPPFAAYTGPALTTFALPVIEAGQVAARMLVNWLGNGRPDQPSNIVLKCTPRIRDSCAAPRR